MGDLVRDVRRSLRALLKERTFSGAVLLTLGICIGANVAIYSVVQTVLLEPLPFEAPDRIVTVYNSYPGGGVPRAGNGSVDFFQRRENVEVFEEVAIFQGFGNTVGGAGSTNREESIRVSPSFFRVLGVDAALGRTFTDDEMDVGNHQKVIITHGYWQDVLAGGADVVGRELRLDGEPFTIVGVLDEDFPMLFSRDARFFLPIPFNDQARQLDQWHSNNFGMIARLRRGASVEQADAQIQAVNESLIDLWPFANGRQLLTDLGFETIVVPTSEELVRDIEPILYMLWAGVALVLLIGCVNVANLMLARAQGRVGEVATVLALGATRFRVARRALTEAAVIGVVGGLFGLAVGYLGLGVIRDVAFGNLPRGAEVAIDVPDVLFTLLLAVGAGVVFGLIPMVQAMRSDLSPVFRSGGRTGTASRRAVLLRNGLVIGQVAIAFVMLIGAGLLLMSFRAALAVDPGFRPEGVLTAYVSLPGARYQDADARRVFWDELLNEVRALPGVDGASVTSNLPFSGNWSSNVIRPEGYEPPPGESVLAPFRTVVGPGYFEALGIDLVEGRAFDASDGPEALRVMIIDEWLANRYWGDRSPIGARMIFGSGLASDSVPEDGVATIVGVVRTVKQNDLTTPAAEHVGAYYYTYPQQTPSVGTLAVHSETGNAAGLTPAVRTVLGRLDPEMPLFGVETMEGRIDASLADRRTPMTLVGVFAGVALFLAAIGIYGALAYAVAQRTHEIGIRMAMGSTPAHVFRSVVTQGLGVTALGLAAGAGASLLLTRLVQSLLFDVRATDPRVMLGVAVGLGAVAFLACVVPARRATSVSPVEALLGP